MSKPTDVSAAQTGEIHRSYIWSLEDGYSASSEMESRPRPLSLSMRSIRMQALIFSDVLAVIISVASAYWLSVFIRWCMGTSTPEDAVRLMENASLIAGGGGFGHLRVQLGPRPLHAIPAVLDRDL